MTLFMKPEKLADKYNRSLNANSPIVTRVPGTPRKTVEELEQETLLPQPPLSLCPSSGFCSKGTTEYIGTMSTQRELPDPHDLHDYLEVDVVSRLRSLQTEIDILKNSMQTSGGSTKSKDSQSIYEKIEQKQPQRQSTVVHKTSRATLEARSRGLYNLSKVCDSNTAVFCRVFWVLLMLVSLGMAAFHLTDRALLFYSEPFHYSVQNKPAASLSFPAVTICNLNQFRLTAVSKLDLYDVLYALLHEHTSDKTVSFANDAHRLDMTYKDFSQSTGHSMKDFVHKCQWQNAHCGYENFTEIFTDLGLCYRFLPHSDKRLIYKPGQQSGVFLILNVEQYEYILGPMSAVGAAIAIHDPDEPPVKFIHVPVGKYTSLELSKSTELASSTQSCKGDNQRQCEQLCKDLHIARRCRCTFPPNWMYKNTYKQCLLYDYVVCVKRLQERPSDDCQCNRENCKSTDYKITSSYATIPKYGAESEVRTLRYHNNIQEKFRFALDTYHRVDKVIAEYDKTTLYSLSTGFNDCANITKKFVKYIKGYSKEFDAIIEKLKNAFVMYNRTILVHYQSIKQGQHIYFAQFIGSSRDLLTDIHNKENELSSAWDENKAVSTATDVLWNIKQLAGTPSGSNVSASSFLDQIQDGLNVFRSKVANSFNGAFSEFRKHKEYYNGVIEEMLVLTKSLEKTLVDRYRDIKAAVEANTNRKQRITQALRTVFNDVLRMRTSEMRKILNLEISFRKEFHTHQRTVIQEMEKVDGMSYEFDEQFVLFSHNITQIVKIVNVTTEMLLYLGKRLGDIANNYSQARFGKIELSKELEKFETINRLHKLQANNQLPKEIVEAMPQEALNLSETIQSVTDHLQGFNLARGKELTDSRKWLEFEELSLRSDKMRKKIESATQAMATYYGEIQMYTSGRKIDEVFYRSNFLYLDIYYKHMMETVMRRERTYTLLDLSCDVGGVLALYLGASLLTVFDIFDFLVKLLCCSGSRSMKNNNI